jgi:hypothetical protein
MMTFLTPVLLWGMTLGAIPLIIHLLNRRRYRRVEWAPMRYLKLTIQKNRRRIQIEQLLLLLLRISLPILLFFFLARPVINPTGLERWLGGGGRTSQVVLVDDSLSMGYTPGGAPAFHRARETAASLLGAVRPQDRCTIVTTSAPKAPVLHEVEGSRKNDLSAAALSLPLSATHASWPAVLEGLDEVLKACTYPTRQLTIVTDLRRAGWDAAVGAIARRWYEQGVRVRVVDTGADQTGNVALQALLPLDRTVLAGAPSRWEAVVRNDSPRVLTGIKAILRVDEKPTEVALPEIAPRQTVRVPINVQFPGPGPHDLSLQLPDDELSGDNQFWAAVPVKDSLLIRLVDGEPSTEPFGSEVDYLAAPLSIGVGAAEAWRVEVAQESDFLSPRLETPDVLVLANVAAVTLDQAQQLGTLAREGMGLIIFTGGKLDPALYNDLLARGNDSLLPCRMKNLVEENFHGVIVENVRPSPLEKLLELKTSALERVPVRQIMTVEEPTENGAARVLARWNDPGRSPAVIERIVGEGRVLLFTTTADRAGNDWPIEPSFVLAIREAVLGTARATRLTNNVTAGERAQRIVYSSQQISNVRLTAPGVTEPRPLAAVPRDDERSERGPSVAITLPDTRKAGLYRLDWEEGPLGARQDMYAANPDPRESTLERITPADLKKLLSPLTVEVAAARDDRDRLFSPTGREIWHSLAWGLFVLLVAEAILAAWVGRSR